MLIRDIGAEEKQHDEYHLMLVRIFEVTHIENTKILKALFCAKDDVHPLYHGSSKTRVNLNPWITFDFLYIIF